MGRRRKAREVALQALYQMDVAGNSPEDALTALRESFGQIDAGVLGYAEALVRGVTSRRDVIDETIQRHSPNWRIERMARVDRNILRLGAFEILYQPDVPPNVAINEAIEIAKRFGTEDSGSFINGILDKVAHAEAPEPGLEG